MGNSVYEINDCSKMITCGNMYIIIPNDIYIKLKCDNDDLVLGYLFGSVDVGKKFGVSDIVNCVYGRLLENKRGTQYFQVTNLINSEKEKTTGDCDATHMLLKQISGRRLLNGSIDDGDNKWSYSNNDSKHNPDIAVHISYVIKNIDWKYQILNDPITIPDNISCTQGGGIDIEDLGEIIVENPELNTENCSKVVSLGNIYIVIRNDILNILCMGVVCPHDGHKLLCKLFGNTDVSKELNVPPGPIYRIFGDMKINRRGTQYFNVTGHSEHDMRRHKHIGRGTDPRPKHMLLKQILSPISKRCDGSDSLWTIPHYPHVGDVTDGVNNVVYAIKNIGWKYECDIDVHNINKECELFNLVDIEDL